MIDYGFTNTGDIPNTDIYMLSRVLHHLNRKPAHRVYWRQLYFSGAQGAVLCMIIGACFAIALYGLLHNTYGQSGDFILTSLATVGLAEFAPLLIAIVLVARSASAMASELATMQVNGEVRFLQRMGIAPLEYLVIPRISSTMIAALLLFLYFVALMMLTGSLLIAPAQPILALYRLAELSQSESLRDGLFRSGIFGLVLGSIACWEGLRAENNSNAIPKAASRAVLRGLLLIFILDALFNLL